MKRKPLWPGFRGLTRAHIHAFERVAFCNPPSCTNRTLETLIARGLVAKIERTTRDRFGVYTVPDYYVPMPVHMSWCLWYGDDDYGIDAVAP